MLVEEPLTWMRFAYDAVTGIFLLAVFAGFLYFIYRIAKLDSNQ